VAGLAALIKAANPSFTPAQIASAMQSSAIDLGAAGRDNRYGWGRIDAAAALGVATAAATTADSAGVSSEPVTRESDAEIAPGRVLVRLQPGVAAQTALSALADAGLGAQVTAAVPQIEVLVLSVPEGAEWDVIEWLQSLPQVVYAEPDLVVRLY
jgi:hypothetical protein